MTLPAIIELQTRSNKEGKEYQMFVVKYQDPTSGELLTIYEAYPKAPLLELLSYLNKKDAKTPKRP
jgi:hypothetical protein